MLIVSQKDAYRPARETISTHIHLSLTLSFNDKQVRLLITNDLVGFKLPPLAFQS